jgi:hypothetical protein
VDLSIILPPDSFVADAAYLHDFKQGWVALTNQKMKLGFALTWPVSIYPWMWLWQVYGGELSAPFFGRTYTIGLEPFTSYPNSLDAAIAAGTAPILNPHECVKATLKVIIYSGLRRVSGIDKDGQVTGV